jgi:ribosomal protein L11 methylase PrmA
MNMICPEQQALAPQRFNPLAKLWIVSGILESQKKAYLSQTAQWNWRLLSEYQKSEWVGFLFIPR